MPSQQTTPILTRQTPQQSYFSNQPQQLQYSNLQGLDFLQSLQGGGNFDANDFNTSGEGANQMDLNFGLGWEGLHHDFSDGQQLDLFDGFFFGDQRGAGGAGGGGGGLMDVTGGAAAIPGNNGGGGGGGGGTAGKMGIEDLLDEVKEEP
jgi:hypothetical protein